MAAFQAGTAVLLRQAVEQINSTDTRGYSTEMASSMPFHQAGGRTVTCAFSPFGNFAAAA